METCFVPCQLLQITGRIVVQAPLRGVIILGRVRQKAPAYQLDDDNVFLLRENQLDKYEE